MRISGPLQMLTFDHTCTITLAQVRFIQGIIYRQNKHEHDRSTNNVYYRSHNLVPHRRTSPSESAALTPECAKNTMRAYESVSGVIMMLLVLVLTQAANNSRQSATTQACWPGARESAHTAAWCA